MSEYRHTTHDELFEAAMVLGFCCLVLERRNAMARRWNGHEMTAPEYQAAGMRCRASSASRKMCVDGGTYDRYGVDGAAIEDSLDNLLTLWADGRE